MTPGQHAQRKFAELFNEPDDWDDDLTDDERAWWEQIAQAAMEGAVTDLLRGTGVTFGGISATVSRAIDVPPMDGQ